MTLIRKVVQNVHSEKWAYIETSDENDKHLVVLGEKEFDDEDSAIAWSLGFLNGSYEYDSLRVELLRLMKQHSQIHDKIVEVLEKLSARDKSNSTDAVK